MKIRIPEKRKVPGVSYAVTPDGVEVAVVDVSNPLFVPQFGANELDDIREDSMRRWSRSRRTPRFLVQFLAKRSLLFRGTIEAADGYLSGMASYYQKLGPDLLGRGYAGRLDRKLANYIGPVCMRMRSVAMAKHLGDALAESLRAHPGRAAWLINLGGGPASDSLNALIVVRCRDRALLEGRRIRLSVLDRDDEGPAFARNCLDALTQSGGPLNGLDVDFEHQRWNWANPDSLLGWFQRHAIADDAVAVSTEGALFEYGSDAEIVENLNLLRGAVSRDVGVVGSVFRDVPVTRMVKELGRLTLKPRNRDVFSLLIRQAGWRIRCEDEGNPMSYVVWLAPDGGRD